MAKCILSMQHQVSKLLSLSLHTRTVSCHPSWKLSQWNSRLLSNVCKNRLLPPTTAFLSHGLGDFDRIQKRHMAGHSKWQNIRHIKSAKDAQKQTIANQVTNRIRVAIREGGDSNPEFNYKLAQVLRYGASHNVPKTTLERAVKDCSKNMKAGSLQFVECRGPYNTFLIVEAFTDKPKWCRQEVTRIMKKYGGSIGNKGFASHSFDYKGVVRVPLKEGETPDLDAATETAIEAGAEDVTSISDENNTRILEYICESTDLHKVKKNLEGTGDIVSEARLCYVPKTLNPLTPEEIEILGQVFDELEMLDSVVRVYDNAELKE